MPLRLLFVCSGNICRSPTAEAVMRRIVDEAGLADEIVVDSAGTGGWHVGEPPDSRAVAAAGERSLALDGVARQITPGDFAEFDLILAVDDENLRRLRRVAPPGAAGRIRKLASHDVPDRTTAGRTRSTTSWTCWRRTAARCSMSFVKTDPAPLEAAGLRWLAAAGARVPKILAEEPGRLVLESVPRGRLNAAGEEDLGRMLATMHRAGAARFGTLPAPGRFFVGRCELDSPESDDWSSYYLEHRSLPLARRLGLEAEVAAVRVEAPVEPVARLHGDLWSGNVLAGRDGLPWLIDPAAYGGHREMDLAMLDLFGSIPARTAAAYDEAYPLADGWRDRIRLWQLFPLLVHAVLFGGGYARQAVEVARAYR